MTIKSFTAHSHKKLRGSMTVKTWVVEKMMIPVITAAFGLIGGTVWSNHGDIATLMEADKTKTVVMRDMLSVMQKSQDDIVDIRVQQALNGSAIKMHDHTH